jgi:TolA-binding protein
MDIHLADAGIYNLRTSHEADFVPPSEESVFVLTAYQLQKLITQAIQPLQDRISEMKERIDRLEEENTSMRLKMASMESFEEQDVTRICLDIAQDRQRLARLETQPRTGTAPTAPPHGEKIVARIAKLKDFLKDRGGGATFQECERLLGIRPNQMTKLVSQLDKRSYEVFTRAGDGRQRVLRLKAQIVSRER